MIAYGMLYAAAVGLPIALAAVAISAVLRRHGKPERLVWIGALLTALVLPLVALLDPFGASSSATPAAQTGVIGLPEILVVPADGRSFELGEMLLATWLLASMLLAVRWAVAALRLARASRSWSPTTLDGVRVWTTEKLGPAVAGTFRPRVLVPTWLHGLPAQQRSLVLLHEQEHIRAHDPKLIALARLTRVLAPWNPIVWFLSARLVRAVELDCDRRVLRQSADVATYGHTLLTLSERRPGQLVAVAAFAESEAPLRSRILAMTTPTRTISVVALLTSMVLGVVLLIGALEIPVPSVSVQVSLSSGEQPAVEPTTRERQNAAAPTEAATRNADSEVGALEEEARAAQQRARAELEAARVEAEAGERARAEVERQTETQRPTELTGGRLREDRGDISARPVFTPYTVAPSILNREDVVRAMVDAYPALLRDAGIGGTVRVFFFIAEDGMVQNTRIDQSSGHPALDDAALAVASVYRFSPALNRDRPTPVWVSFPITFQPR